MTGAAIPAPYTTAATTRRALLGAGVALGAAVPLLATTAAPAHADDTTSRLPSPTSGAAQSALDAFAFLQKATDAYATSGLRLVQSFGTGYIGDAGLLQDNAVTCIALLAAGDWPRARAIGDALLYAQDHDPEHDGRLRRGYSVEHLVHADGSIDLNPGFGYITGGTDTGSMAWAGLAFAHLARRTGRAGYLAGLRRIAAWIVEHTRSDNGDGGSASPGDGFTFGEVPGKERQKSTEHNIVLYALFRLMAQLTGERTWLDHARHAFSFVLAAYDAQGDHFWGGSDGGSTVDTTPTQIPLNAQTLYWLATAGTEAGGEGGDAAHRRCLDWARTCLATTDTSLRVNSSLKGSYAVSGVTYGSGSLTADVTERMLYDEDLSKPDLNAVWFEGNAQLALALYLRNASHDRDRYAALLAEIRSAQGRLVERRESIGLARDGGVVAASSPLDTGFQLAVTGHLHTGTTSWYLIAAMKDNPFRF